MPQKITTLDALFGYLMKAPLEGFQKQAVLNKEFFINKTIDNFSIFVDIGRECNRRPQIVFQGVDGQEILTLIKHPDNDNNYHSSWFNNNYVSVPNSNKILESLPISKICSQVAEKINQNIEDKKNALKAEEINGINKIFNLEKYINNKLSSETGGANHLERLFEHLMKVSALGFETDNKKPDTIKFNKKIASINIEITIKNKWERRPSIMFKDSNNESLFTLYKHADKDNNTFSFWINNQYVNNYNNHMMLDSLSIKKICEEIKQGIFNNEKKNTFNQKEDKRIEEINGSIADIRKNLSFQLPIKKNKI